MPEGFPRSTGKEHSSHELDPCQYEGNEQIPAGKPSRLLDQGEAEEETGKGEPQADSGRGMHGEEEVIAK